MVRQSPCPTGINKGKILAQCCVAVVLYIRGKGGLSAPIIKRESNTLSQVLCITRVLALLLFVFGSFFFVKSEKST